MQTKEIQMIFEELGIKEISILHNPTRYYRSAEEAIFGILKNRMIGVIFLKKERCYIYWYITADEFAPRWQSDVIEKAKAIEILRKVISSFTKGSLKKQIPHPVRLLREPNYFESSGLEYYRVCCDSFLEGNWFHREMFKELFPLLQLEQV